MKNLSRFAIFVTAVFVCVCLPALGQGVNTFIKGLAPDWGQPLDYPDTFDPTGPPPLDTYWNAWCAPTSAAMLIGHWEDVKGWTGLADGSADGNQSIPFGYAGPLYGLGAAWHDRTADGNPSGLGGHPMRGLRTVNDLGWHLDTNGSGVNGVPHIGTFYGDMAPGLNSFFTAVNVNSPPGGIRGELKAKTLGIDPVFGGYSNQQLADILKNTIDRNNTAIAHFSYWNLLLSGPPASPGDGTEDEEDQFDIEEYHFWFWWPFGPHNGYCNGVEDEGGLGHAVLVVGYTQNVWGMVTHLIVHDNDTTTQRNVKVPVGPELVAITLVSFQLKKYTLEHWDQKVEGPIPPAP